MLLGSFVVLDSAVGYFFPLIKFAPNETPFDENKSLDDRTYLGWKVTHIAHQNNFLARAIRNWLSFGTRSVTCVWWSLIDSAQFPWNSWEVAEFEPATGQTVLTTGPPQRPYHSAVERSKSLHLKTASASETKWTKREITNEIGRRHSPCRIVEKFWNIWHRFNVLDPETKMFNIIGWRLVTALASKLF